MATKRVEIHAGEAAVIAGLLAERDSVTKSLTVAVQMICAREAIPTALLEGMDGNAILLEVPDIPDAKRDRTGAPAPVVPLSGGASVAPTAETPSETKPAGKAFPFDRPGEAPEIREHATGG